MHPHLLHLRLACIDSNMLYATLEACLCLFVKGLENRRVLSNGVTLSLLYVMHNCHTLGVIIILLAVFGCLLPSFDMFGFGKVEDL